MKDERRKRSSSLELACFCLVQGFESCNRIDSIFMGSGEVGPPFTKLCVAKTAISPLQNLSISFFLSLSLSLFSPLNGISNSEMYTKAHTFGTRPRWSLTLVTLLLSNYGVIHQDLF